MRIFVVNVLLAMFVIAAVCPTAAVAKEPTKRKTKNTVESKFKTLDTDSSGDISLDEFCGKKKGSARTRAEKLFGRYDTDQSESLSLDEFKAKGKKSNAKKKSDD